MNNSDFESFPTDFYSEGRLGSYSLHFLVKSPYVGRTDLYLLVQSPHMGRVDPIFHEKVLFMCRRSVHFLKRVLIYES